MRICFDDDGQAEFFFNVGGKVVAPVDFAIDNKSRRGEFGGLKKTFRGDFVHRQRGGKHSRTCVRNFQHVERALNQTVLAVATVHRVEDNAAVFGANVGGKSLRIEFHKLDVVIFRLERVGNRLARSPRNFSLRRRASAHDDNFPIVFVLFEHFQKFFARLVDVARAHRDNQIARRQLIFNRGGNVFAFGNVADGLIGRSQNFAQN